MGTQRNISATSTKYTTDRTKYANRAAQNPADASVGKSIARGKPSSQLVSKHHRVELISRLDDDFITIQHSSLINKQSDPKKGGPIGRRRKRLPVTKEEIEQSVALLDALMK